MSNLFEATSINAMRLKNRFVRSAAGLSLAAPDGVATPRLIEVYTELAEGGVGLIITGPAFVSDDARVGDGQLGIHSDDLVPNLRELTDTVHAAGAKIAVQIAHAGLFSGLFSAPKSAASESLGPSPLKNEQGVVGREMARLEISAAVEAFGDAAARAKKAGFDAVQIHGAHGFLVGQFLSPYSNKRTDEYGESIENRARLLIEVVVRVRQAVGAEYPILVKINSDDRLEGGFSSAEMLAASLMLENNGVDAVELSGGTIAGVLNGDFDITFSPVSRQGIYYEEAARSFKKEINLPLMLVGGIRSYDECLGIVEEGIADYISLCRPLIREPDLIKRWQSGDTRDSECISDNLCSLSPGHGTHCVHVGGYRKKKGLLKFYSGSSTSVNTKRAVADCLEDALGEGRFDCDLVIFHTTMGHNFEEIVSELHRLSPNARTIGCTCGGVISRAGPNESLRALSAMVIKGSPDGFAVAGAEINAGEDVYEAAKRVAMDLKHQNANTNMILLFPALLALPYDRVVDGVDSAFASKVPIFGAIAIDNMATTSLQFIDDKVIENGIVAVGFADPTLELIARACHGFDVIGESFEVTRSDGARIYELNGTPAIPFLRDRLGLPETASRLEMGMLMYLAEELPRDFHEEYGSRYILRGAGGLQYPDGSTVVQISCPVGTSLRLAKRDEEKIFRDLDRMIADMKGKIGGRKPVAVFHADCIVRGRRSLNQFLKEEIVHHMQQPLNNGENVPWLGMYGGGEISPLGGKNRVHTFTTSLNVIVEGE